MFPFQSLFPVLLIKPVQWFLFEQPDESMHKLMLGHETSNYRTKQALNEQYEKLNAC